MSVADAQLSREMASKVEKAVPVIQKNFYTINPVLKILQNKIKWNGSATEVEWYIVNEPGSGENPDWGGGELGLNTFEEIKPVNKVTLPFNWLQKNYGVSDRTLESGRHASGKFKIFDALKQNLQSRQTSIYNVIAPAIYNGDGGSGDGDADGSIVGLMYAAGNPYETTNNVTVDSGASYAGRTLNSSGISSYSKNKADWDDAQWAPECIDVQEIRGASNDWSTECMTALAYMEETMAVTPDMSGTGEVHKPDFAFMALDPWASLVNKWLSSHGTWNVPMASKSLKASGWNNMAVGGLTVVHDNNVPDDSGGVERVLVIDSKQIKIHTTHSKKEGLIKNEFDPDNGLVTGAIGSLKLNFLLRVASPTAVGVITGCDS